MKNLTNDESSLLMFDNLPLNISLDFINYFVSQCVKPISIFLHEHQLKKTKFALLKFGTKQEALDIRNMLNLSIINGKSLQITFADIQTRNLIRSGGIGFLIKGIDKSFDSYQLFKTFNHVGEIIFCDVIDQIGYLQFRDKSSLDRAKGELYDLIGQSVQIGEFVKPRENKVPESHTSIFIKNLPPFIKNEIQLTVFFEQYGSVHFVQLFESKDKKKFGFCKMKKREDSSAAVVDLFQKVIDDDLIFAISPLRLDHNDPLNFLYLSSLYLNLNKFEENFDFSDLKKLINRFQQYEGSIAIEDHHLLRDVNSFSYDSNLFQPNFYGKRRAPILFKIISDKGLKDGNWMFGCSLLFNYYPKFEKQISMALFHKAQIKNINDGIFWLEYKYYFEKDYLNSISLFQVLAQKKHAGGLFLLGDSLAFGRGIKKNIDEGLKLVTFAGEIGDAFLGYKSSRMF